MSNRRVRPATLDDARAIGTLHTESWQTAYRGILPDALLDGLDIEARVAQRSKMLANPASPEIRNWVLEEDDVVAGWAATGPTRDDDLDEATHELYAIYLRPDQVGRGCGRTLMAHCVADAVERGKRAMTMWVLSGNERAQRFYAAAGFEADSRVPPAPFGETGATKLRMVRLLP